MIERRERLTYAGVDAMLANLDADEQVAPALAAEDFLAGLSELDKAWLRKISGARCDRDAAIAWLWRALDVAVAEGIVSSR
jgi:hypothetical protein